MVYIPKSDSIALISKKLNIYQLKHETIKKNKKVRECQEIIEVYFKISTQKILIFTK